MTTGAVSPGRGDLPRAGPRPRRVVPVTRRLLADGETPVGVYRKLAGGPGTFLLESAEQGAGGGGRGLVAVLVHRRAQHRHADRARRRGASGSGSPPAGVPTERRPGRGAARRRSRR